MNEPSEEAKQAAGARGISKTYYCGEVFAAFCLGYDAATAKDKETIRQLREVLDRYERESAKLRDGYLRDTAKLGEELVQTIDERAKLREENDRLWKLLDQANHTLLEAGLAAVAPEKPKQSDS